MKQVIQNFFVPKTIAVIGASDNPLKVGNVLMKKLCECKRKVIPINIKRPEVAGKKAYQSVLKYPGKIDLAVIAIPSKFVNSALIECGKKKIKSVIVISSGFSEVGNKSLEIQILNTAKKYKMRILGPNCFGVANPYLNLDTTFSNTSAQPGNIAVISQSGALWSYISDFDFKFSGFVSLGNMSDLTFSDFIEYFNKDKKTKKIVLYIEKLKFGKRFIEICQKSKKQIIIVKAGKTKKGSEAAVSHTGSLATEFAVYSGAFKQARVKVVDSLAEAFKMKREKIKFNKKPRKVKIITNAGGAAALLTDYLTKQGIETKVKDLLGTALARDYKREIKKSKGQLVVVLTPQKMSEPTKTAQVIPKSAIACFLGKKSIKRAVKILKTKNIKYYTRCC
jgi:acyl-CoA synthetase (NDP forming)